MQDTKRGTSLSPSKGSCLVCGSPPRRRRRRISIARFSRTHRINQISRYGKEGFEKHGKQPGSVMVVAFELEGQKFVALNGGPQFKFSEAISFQIHCETQKEVDYFWDKRRDLFPHIICDTHRQVWHALDDRLREAAVTSGGSVHGGRLDPALV